MRFLPSKALNPTQEAYLDALRTCPQVIVLGPAGTGKTWMAATHAADLLRNRQIDKIILTRPNVPCGRSLGYFPGTLEAKFAPWAAPVIEAIKERIGKAAYEIALKHGDIELVPFEVMRGRSWKNAFVLLDEAQNTHARRDQDVPHPHRRGLHGGDQRRRQPVRPRPGERAATVIHLIKSQTLSVPVIEFGPRRHRPLRRLRHVGAGVRRGEDLAAHEASAGLHPPLEGEGRERSERGGVIFVARKAHPTPPPR